MELFCLVYAIHVRLGCYGMSDFLQTLIKIFPSQQEAQYLLPGSLWSPGVKVNISVLKGGYDTKLSQMPPFRLPWNLIPISALFGGKEMDQPFWVFLSPFPLSKSLPSPLFLQPVPQHKAEQTTDGQLTTSGSRSLLSQQCLLGGEPLFLAVCSRVLVSTISLCLKS